MPGFTCAGSRVRVDVRVCGCQVWVDVGGRLGRFEGPFAYRECGWVRVGDYVYVRERTWVGGWQGLRVHFAYRECGLRHRHWWCHIGWWGGGRASAPARAACALSAPCG